jgi:NAD(P)-dependent dehydrogenase (short-subunit alcohol dehydrogenase family)
VTRGILIAGNESTLFSTLCTEAAKRVETYTAAFIPRNQGPESVRNVPSEKRITLDWNPPSPVSAKAMVLSALNKMEHIDDAILVCVPPAYRKNAEEFTAAEIDRFIDHNIKGWFFLARELTAVFKARGQGTLSLVLPELSAGSKPDAPDLTGPVVTAAFRSFAQGILLSSLNAPYEALGFSLPEPGEENAFAAFIFKTIEEGKRASGRWHKYGKFGFLGR